MGRKDSSSPSHSSPKKVKDDKFATVLIEEKPAKPAVASRFTRKKLDDSLAAGAMMQTKGEEEIELLTDENFCQSLLVGGYVQSYVDFYHLSHRVDPNMSDSSSTQKIQISLEDMTFIKDNLIAAEIARRQGNTAGVYAAYTRLADYYVGLSDWRTAIYFHEKCLEVAKLTTDSRAEMSALHASGFVCQKMGDYESALKFHERQEEHAKLFDVVEEVKRANVELYRVYLVIAAKMEAEERFDDALELYNKCLHSSKKCWDRAAEGEANGKIGALLLGRGKTAECIPYLREYSQISADMGSAEGRCKACSALAIALDTLGQSDKALNELKVVQATSEQSGDVILQAQASRALGTLYSKVGDFDAALDSFQRHFGLLKSILLLRNSAGHGGAKISLGGVTDDYLSGPATAAAVVTAADLDLARSFVGIAKGNLLMGHYVMVIKGDLSALLDWKLNRADFHEHSDS